LLPVMVLDDPDDARLAPEVVGRALVVTPFDPPETSLGRRGVERDENGTRPPPTAARAMAVAWIGDPVVA